MITYKKTDNQHIVVEYLVDAIASHLAESKRVLWLVAGGSAMDIAVKVAEKLAEKSHLDLLTITLTDERYGEEGHPDSNWRQLKDKGFRLPGAKMMPVLSGMDLPATVDEYSMNLNNAAGEADFSIALAGMGADGHIFGVKPDSPAVNGVNDVVGYEWQDYVRITPTIKFLKQLDEIVLFVMGADKHRQLDDIERELPVSEQPAQLLKSLRQVIIFNDYKGDTI